KESGPGGFPCTVVHVRSQQHKLEGTSSSEPKSGMSFTGEFPHSLTALSVEADSDEYEPDSEAVITVTGDPGTRVGVLAVDKAVYLLNDAHKLTAQKMFQRMDTFDLGCGPGGGKNAKEVFEDAGMLVMTDASLETEKRESYGCSAVVVARKRRSLSAKANEYNGMLRDFCIDGQNSARKSPIDIENFEEYCTEQASQLEDMRVGTIKQNNERFEAFADCCLSALESTREISSRIGRFESDEFTDDENIDEDVELVLQVRSDFSETWIFSDDFLDENGQMTLPVTVPSSLTQWIVQAVGVNRDTGICVSQPFELLAFKHFFIQLSLPYSVIMREQIEIRATVFNYGARDLAVSAYMYGVEGICSDAKPGERSDGKWFIVKAKNAALFTFTVIPLKVGNFPIKIEALSPIGDDIVERILKVEPAGIQHSFKHSVLLDPTGLLSNRVGVDNTENTDQGPVKNIEHKHFEKHRQFNEIDIRMPADVIPDSPECRVNIGECDVLAQYNCQNQTNSQPALRLYLCTDRASCWFQWFCPLLSGTGRSDGISTKSGSLSKSISYLEGRIKDTDRPYAVAIITYALVLANSGKKHEANEQLRALATYDKETNSRHWTTDAAIFGDGNKPYWYTHNPSAIEVETTAYALLTQVELNDIAYSNAIVVWLTSQRNSQGGFISTQDTIIALYALVKYSAAARNVIETPVHMNCTITIEADDAYSEVIPLNEGSMVQHIREVPVGGKLYIDTTGTGIGNLQVEVRYNTPALYAETCAFNITVNVVEPRLRRRDNTLSNSVIHLTVTVRYNKPGSTGMAIIDVGLFSGFEPIKTYLEKMKNNEAQFQSYDVNKRSVIFYIDQITNQTDVTIEFDIKQVFNVGKVQPVAVKVYDYYSPDVQCTKFYQAEEGSALLDTLCEGYICVCAEGKCGKCLDKQPIRTLENKGDLVEKACHDMGYAFKIHVFNVKFEKGWEHITAIIEVIAKHGIEDVSINDQIHIWKSSTCECPKIEPDVKYFIMGRDPESFVDENGFESYKYLIDETSYIEAFPAVGRRHNILQRVMHSLTDGACTA
uniref:Complement C3-like n=1 Tax=Saccoglossus kowalevskii TaxID=10224 RepID=A0ABM0MSR7_SACKO